MSTSTFMVHIIDILSHLATSFKFSSISNTTPAQPQTINTSDDIVSALSPTLSDEPSSLKPIPMNSFLGSMSSSPNFKSPAAEPLVSFGPSATIAAVASSLYTPPAADAQDNADQGHQELRRESHLEHERESVIDVSVSSFNISLISDTSTSTSSPLSSTEDLSISLSLPPQPLLPAISVFPSQHRDPLPEIDSFFTPESYPYGYSTGTGFALGLGISVPCKDEAGEYNGMVPLDGQGIVGLGGRRSKTSYAHAWPGLYPLEEEEEQQELAGAGDNNEGVSDQMLNEILWTWTADPMHVLCSIPECEEQVAEDLQAQPEADSTWGSGAGAGEAGMVPEAERHADILTESTIPDVGTRLRASISCEANCTRSPLSPVRTLSPRISSSMPPAPAPARSRFCGSVCCDPSPSLRTVTTTTPTHPSALPRLTSRAGSSSDANLSSPTPKPMATSAFISPSNLFTSLTLSFAHYTKPNVNIKTRPKPKPATSTRSKISTNSVIQIGTTILSACTSACDHRRTFKPPCGMA